MNIISECRYLYLVPKGNTYYPDGYYGSLTAVDMQDAKSHLGRWCKGAVIVRVRLGEDDCEKADWGDQEYRKGLFDEAMKRKDGSAK